jgi:hypothetical protein
MAFVPVPGNSFIPEQIWGNSAMTVGSTNINTAGYYIGMVLRSPVTDTITKIGFITGNINNGTIDARVETVDTTTGFPTGTLWATNTNNTQSILAADDNTYFEITLTTPASVTKGDLFAIVFKAVGSSQGGVRVWTAGPNLARCGFPYRIINATGTPAVANTPGAATICFGTAGYIPLNQFLPVRVINSRTVNSTSGTLYGGAYTPFITHKSSSMYLLCDLDQDATIRVYGTDGSTLLATATLLNNVPNFTTAFTYIAPLDTEITFTAGQTYYWVLVPSTTTPNITMYEMEFPTANAKKMYIDSTMEGASVSYPPSSSSDWTVTNTLLFPAGFGVSEIDIPTGGGIAFPIAGARNR